MDNFDWLRLSTMFGDMANPSEVVDTTQYPSIENEAENRLKAHMDTQPKRENYPNSRMQKIMAAIASLSTASPVAVVGGQPIGFKADVPGAMKLKSDYLDSGFNKATYDWQSKLKPLSELADAERASNTNKRLTSASLRSSEIQSRRLDETERNNRVRDENADEDRKIKQQIADINALKAKKPNLHSVVDSKGMLVLWDSTDPDKPPITTNINTGKLSDIDKANLDVKGNLQEIEARSKAAKDLERTKYPEGRPKPSSSTAKAESSSQRKIRLFTRAQQAINEHPEWKDLIELQQGNNFTIKAQDAPGWLDSIFGNSDKDPKDISDDIYEYIYGASRGSDSNVNTATVDDKVVVEKDGKKYRLPKSQLGEATKQGYKQVQ